MINVENLWGFFFNLTQSTSKIALIIVGKYESVLYNSDTNSLPMRYFFKISVTGYIEWESNDHR
jgi:hypothetical protein